MANLACAHPSLGRHLCSTIGTGQYRSNTPIRAPRSPGSA